MGRRVLITGLASFWAGRAAQSLETRPDVEVIVGLDTAEPQVALERTEFVRADDTYSILSRLVAATQVDTVVHASLVVDSTGASGRRIHERNVIGTINLLAAITASRSVVRHVVVKSSALVYGASKRDPTWFAEQTRRSAPARTTVERSLIEVESALDSLVEENPSISVAILRFANVLGDEIVTPLSRGLRLPLAPTIAGFDPQMQFVEQTDVVRAIDFAVERELAGVYNVAGAGRLPWSEIRRIAGRPPLLLPPWLTALATEPLARLGIVDLPPEVIDLLRFGRGIDTRRLVEKGFTYRYTTAGAVERFVERSRMQGAIGHYPDRGGYQADVEAFFRHSPSVVRGDRSGGRDDRCGAR